MQFHFAFAASAVLAHVCKPSEGVFAIAANQALNLHCFVVNEIRINLKLSEFVGDVITSGNKLNVI